MSDIEKISMRHGTSLLALQDFEGRHAILMCLMQIGETLNRLTDIGLIEKLQEYRCT